MRTDSSVPEFTEDTLTRRLPERLLNNITAFAASRSIHLSTVMLSCYMVLLSKYTDKEDIVTGMPAMVRPEERFDGVVGHFLNMLPIRNRAGRKETFADFVQRCRMPFWTDWITHFIRFRKWCVMCMRNPGRTVRLFSAMPFLSELSAAFELSIDA